MNVPADNLSFLVISGEEEHLLDCDVILCFCDCLHSAPPDCKYKPNRFCLGMWDLRAGIQDLGLKL